MLVQHACTAACVQLEIFKVYVASYIFCTYHDVCVNKIFKRSASLQINQVVSFHAINFHGRSIIYKNRKIYILQKFLAI